MDFTIKWKPSGNCELCIGLELDGATVPPRHLAQTVPAPSRATAAIRKAVPAANRVRYFVQANNYPSRTEFVQIYLRKSEPHKSSVYKTNYKSAETLKTRASAIYFFLCT